MADPFIIEERGPNPKRIELRDWDLPHGRPRKEAAFTLGDKTVSNKIYLDGRDTPIVHMRYLTGEPLKIKGHFRDELWAEQGHALFMRSKFKELHGRQRELTVSWGTIRLLATIEGSQFHVEDDANIRYEIEFFIIKDISEAVTVSKSEAVSDPADVVSTIRQRMAARKAAAQAQFAQTIGMLAIMEAYSAADTALQSAEASAEKFEQSTDRARDVPHELESKCEEARARATDLEALATSTDDADFLPIVSAVTAPTWWAFRDDTIVGCAEVIDTMRAIERTSRLAQTPASTLYQVRPGDTVESIALSTLGSPARAGELSIMPRDLVPGRYVRIPART